jgi:hypothetical protein
MLWIHTAGLEFQLYKLILSVTLGKLLKFFSFLICRIVGKIIESIAKDFVKSYMKALGTVLGTQEMPDKHQLHLVNE